VPALSVPFLCILDDLLISLVCSLCICKRFFSAERESGLFHSFFCKVCCLNISSLYIHNKVLGYQIFLSGFGSVFCRHDCFVLI
jgi:hypothetical protein